MDRPGYGSSVNDVDLLQRYRLRQLTRAVYDSAAPHHLDCFDDGEGKEQYAQATTEHPSRSPLRFRRLLDYPAALGAIVACILLLTIMLIKSAAWGIEHQPVALSESADSAGAATQSGELSALGHRRRPMPEDLSQSTVTPTITVHIEGAVARPGIVMLSQGARAYEAIQAAGGATREAALREINLARVLSDGEYFYVPHIGEEQDELPAPAQAAVTMGRHSPSAGNAQVEGTGTTAQGCVDINTADMAGLQVLKGVGPALAQRILEARETRGAFESIDDVDAISGIGPAMLRKIEPQLCALQGR